MSETKNDALARRVAESMLASEGTGPAWGIAIEEPREGYARISMRVRADFLNGHKMAHGGMIFALADTAFRWKAFLDEDLVYGLRLIAHLLPLQRSVSFALEAGVTGDLSDRRS